MAGPEDINDCSGDIDYSGLHFAEDFLGEVTEDFKSARQHPCNCSNPIKSHYLDKGTTAELIDKRVVRVSYNAYRCDSCGNTILERKKPISYRLNNQ